PVRMLQRRALLGHTRCSERTGAHVTRRVRAPGPRRCCPFIATLLVLLAVGSPVLVWQERLGRTRRSFLIYKFRTLGAPFYANGTPSIASRKPSAIGCFLRSTRIDELPQFLNVLLGDISLIGPRPQLPEDQPANTSLRLSVRPGITGRAQSTAQSSSPRMKRKR